MAITDYTALKSALQSYAARSDTKFSAQIPNFVAQAEERIYNGSGDSPQDPTYSPPLRSKALEFTTTIAFTAGSGVVPDECMDLRKIYVVGQLTGIKYLSPERFAVQAANDSGTPRWYTVEGSVISVTPDTTGVLAVDYYRRLSPITDTNVTNAVITAHGLIYLEMALFEAFSWMQEVDLALGHIAKGRSMVSGANRVSERLRFSGKLSIQPRTAIP